MVYISQIYRVRTRNEMKRVNVRTTIKDIATACNVSEGTVDRALNNRYGVSERTKARILRVAEEMNYQPNYIARALATGTTMTICLMCFNLCNNFFPQLIEVIEKNARAKGYFINLMLSHMDQKAERQNLEYVSARGADGIILFPIGKDQSYIKYLKNLRIPVVTMYNYVSDDFSYVGVNNRQGFKEATDYLAGKGYKRIILATPQIDAQKCIGNNVFTLEQRRMGYCDSIIAHDNRPIIIQGYENAIQTALYYARLKDGTKTAVLCSDDNNAYRLMRDLSVSGVAIPTDIGVMGFDNIGGIGTEAKKLTTVGYSIEKMGELLFREVVRQIQGDTGIISELIPHYIVEGDTV